MCTCSWWSHFVFDHHIITWFFSHSASHPSLLHWIALPLIEFHRFRKVEKERNGLNKTNVMWTQNRPILLTLEGVSDEFLVSFCWCWCCCCYCCWFLFNPLIYYLFHGIRHNYYIFRLWNGASRRLLLARRIWWNGMDSWYQKKVECLCGLSSSKTTRTQTHSRTNDMNIWTTREQSLEYTSRVLFAISVDSPSADIQRLFNQFE